MANFYSCMFADIRRMKFSDVAIDKKWVYVSWHNKRHLDLRMRFTVNEAIELCEQLTRTIRFLPKEDEPAAAQRREPRGS